jgi:hypothetical protein
MKNIILTLLVCSWLFGCASNGTGTIGNGQIDIDLGDGKLFGNETAYVWGVTAAQYAVYRNPALGFSIKSELLQARDQIDELSLGMPVADAVDEALDELRKQCKFWCSTVAGKKYMEDYIVLAENIKTSAPPDLFMTPREVIDDLIEQIEIIEALN